MMIARILGISAFSLLLLGGCSSQEDKMPTRLEFENPEEARKILEGDQVVCTGDCPESVAAFYIYHSKKIAGDMAVYSLGLCSATLVDSDRILTNKHCIDGILREGDELTDDSVRIEVKFPKLSQAPFESLSVTKVLKTSQAQRLHMSPDWALLQLEKAPLNRRPVAGMSPDLEDSTEVVLFPVYFDKTFSPTLGRISPVHCDQAFAEGADIFTVDEESPLFLIKNCSRAIISGNSGSAVFHKNQQKIMGVLSGSGTIERSATGTMAHCLPDFKDPEFKCYYSDGEPFIEVYKVMSYLTSVLREFPRLKNEIQASADFEWQASSEIESLDSFTFEFQDPWAQDLKYLDKPESQNLKNRYSHLFAEAVFPLWPKCLKTTSGSLRVPIMKWSHLNQRAYEWKVLARSVREAQVNFQRPPLQGQNEMITAESKRLNSGLYEVTTSETLAPYAKVIWKIPACR